MNLNNIQVDEQQVREFAYQIWESEGRPFGHSERHWEMACKLAATHAEAGADNGLKMGDEDIPAREPIDPISPGDPQHQPVSDPIQPGEPPQPPAQPIAVAPPRKTRAKAIADAPKSLIDNNPISLGEPADPAPKAKQSAALKQKALPTEAASKQASTKEASTSKTSKPRKSKKAEHATENV